MNTELYQPASPAIGKITVALSKAQAHIRHATKTHKNPQTRSTYASLEEVLDTVREPLAQHALAIVQAPYALPEGGLVLVTTIAHESGEWFRSVTPVNPRKMVKGGEMVHTDDMQTVGAAITYARRYALAAMLAVGQEDDDGNTATGRAEPTQRPQPQQQPAPPQRRQPQPQQQPPPPPPEQDQPPPDAPEEASPARRMNTEQNGLLVARIQQLGLDAIGARHFISHMVNRRLESAATLTHDEAEAILSLTIDDWQDALDQYRNPPPADDSAAERIPFPVTETGRSPS